MKPQAREEPIGVHRYAGKENCPHGVTIHEIDTVFPHKIPWTITARFTEATINPIIPTPSIPSTFALMKISARLRKAIR